MSNPLPTQDPSPSAPQSEFASCPNCGQSTAKRVGWTLWGGALGPRLLTHVKCQSCGFSYNGKTGRPNGNAIAIYIAVSAVLGVALAVLALVLANLLA